MIVLNVGVFAICIIVSFVTGFIIGIKRSNKV